MANEEVIELTYLENKSNNHNKFYQIELLSIDHKTYIRTSYGRIGNGATVSPLSKPFRFVEDARRERNKIRDSKMVKGYRIVLKTISTQHAPVDVIVSPPKVTKFSQLDMILADKE